MNAQLSITVRVKLFGFLAERAGQAELVQQIGPGTKVADVIHRAADRLGPDFRQVLLDQHGNLHGGIDILLNQRQIAARRIFEITLQDNDVLVLIPLVGGGRGCVSDFW